MSHHKRLVWFAKGFSARARHVEFDPPDRKDGRATTKLPGQVAVSQEKRQSYMEGWEWASSLFRHNLEPYTEKEIDVLASRNWVKANAEK